MKRVLRILAVLLVAGVVFAVPAKAGPGLPDFQMPVTFSAEHAEYLGLSDSVSLFRFSDVKTEFLLVNVFNLYCGPCQRDAPDLNEMYEKIAVLGLEGRIKFLGLAAGNSVRETEFWRAQFNVPFPLIADQDYVMHKGLGDVSTPYFFLVRVAGPGQLETLFSREGAFDNKDAFFAEILAHTRASVAARN